MKLRRRIRAAIKWTGATITVLLLVAWLASKWYNVYGFSSGLVTDVSCGRLLIGWSTPWLGGGFDWDVSRNSSSDPALRQFRWWFGGFRKIHGTASTETAIAVPIWFLMTLTGVPTVLMFRTDRRRAKIAQHILCSKCGYDLTGLPADRACPECGATTLST